MIENSSGFKPFDTRVLVLPDAAAEKQGSIILPDKVRDQERWAQTKGTLIAVGANAFMDWGSEADKPVPGDRVVFGKYAGATHRGADGRDYTVCNDEDILALWTGD